MSRRPPLPTLPSDRSIHYSRSNRRLIRESDLAAFGDDSSDSSSYFSNVMERIREDESSDKSDSDDDNESREKQRHHRRFSSSDSECSVGEMAESGDAGRQSGSESDDSSFGDRRRTTVNGSVAMKKDDHSASSSGSEDSSYGNRRRTVNNVAKKRDDHSVSDSESEDSSFGDRRRATVNNVAKNRDDISVSDSESDASSFGDRRRATVMNNVASKGDDHSVSGSDSDASSFGDRRRATVMNDVAKNRDDISVSGSESDASSFGDRRRATVNNVAKKRDDISVSGSESDASSFGDRRSATVNNVAKKRDDISVSGSESDASSFVDRRRATVMNSVAKKRDDISVSESESDASSFGGNKRRDQSSSNSFRSESDASSLGDRRRTTMNAAPSNDTQSRSESENSGTRTVEDQSAASESSLIENKSMQLDESLKGSLQDLSVESVNSQIGHMSMQLDESLRISQSVELVDPRIGHMSMPLDESLRRSVESVNSQIGHMSMPLDESLRRSVQDQSVEFCNSQFGNASKQLDTSMKKDNSPIENRSSPKTANKDVDQSFLGEPSSKHLEDDCNRATTPDGTVKKLIKLRVWDENNPNVHSIVTVEVNVRSKRQDFANADNSNSAILSVGGTVQLRDCSSESWDGSQLVEIMQVPVDDVKDMDINNEPQVPQAKHTPYTETHSVPQSARANEAMLLEPTIRKEDKANTQPSELKGIKPFVIPSIVSATYTKSSPDQKVGLAFRKAKSTIVIEKILPGSAFDGSDLRAGQECLCINSHRIRSARRAAEIVKETATTLTLMVSTAKRPPGTSYTIVKLGREHTAGDEAAGGDANASARGMTFETNEGLVQLTKVNATSPVVSSSLKVGDFILAINGVVTGSVKSAIRLLSQADVDVVSILYFNMRQLRMCLIDKVLDESWKREWSDTYEECVVLPPTENSNPLTLRFREDGSCVLIDPLRAFRMKFGADDNTADGGNSISTADHPLNSAVDTLNNEITCVLDAIRQGIDKQTREEIIP